MKINTFTIFFTVTSVSGNFISDILPDYDYHAIGHVKRDIRHKFLLSKKNKEKGKKLGLDSAVEMYEGISHIRVGNHPRENRVKAFERELRQVLTMDGVKYNYRRDSSWRTWRKVDFSNGTQGFVHYNCKSTQDLRTGLPANCDSWVIDEDKLSCPFEILSMFSNREFCCTNITNIGNISAECPTKITYSDLTSCGNPMKTSLQIIRDYKASRKNLKMICQGRDSCDIHTFYQLLKESVVFRIINANNLIIYSKIMKPNNENFACVEECGQVDPETGNTAQKDNPMRLNLLQSTSRKKKRKIRKLSAKNSNLHAIR